MKIYIDLEKKFRFFFFFLITINEIFNNALVFYLIYSFDTKAVEFKKFSEVCIVIKYFNLLKNN